MSMGKRKNPFAAYQRKRSEEKKRNIQAAIATLLRRRQLVTLSAVADLAEMSVNGIKANPAHLMLVEKARVDSRKSRYLQNLNPDEPAGTPSTLNDAIGELRILRFKIKELRKENQALRSYLKRYNPEVDINGKLMLMPIARGEDRNLEVIIAILRDLIHYDNSIFEVRPEGITTSIGTVIIEKKLLRHLGLDPQDLAL